MHMPDFSHVAQRGAIIGNTLEKAFNIIGQTMTGAVQQYQQSRNLDTAYKGVRSYVLDNQEKYGLSDEQADAMMSKMKYREGETIEQYENRIRPTLFNMTLYNTYKKEDPEFDVDMPDPFLDQQSFITAMGHFAKIKKQQEMGEAIQDYYLEEVFEGPRSGTQEQMGTMVAGRMGGRPVSEEELQQFPEYRALPSQADVLKQEQLQQEQQRKQEMHETNVALKKQHEKTSRASELYKNTASRVKSLSGSGNKKGAIDNIKDLATITKLEIATTEMIKNMEDINRTEGISNSENEEWVNMKELAGVLKEKRTELAKKPGDVQPSMEATSEANKIERFVSNAEKSGDTSDPIQLMADMIYDSVTWQGFPKQYVDTQKIKQALLQGEKPEAIIERYMQGKKQLDRGLQPQQPTVGVESGG